jgi:hypothetical protein
MSQVYENSELRTGWSTVDSDSSRRVTSPELRLSGGSGHGGALGQHEEREGIPAVLTTGRRRLGSNRKWLVTNFDELHPPALSGKVAGAPRRRAGCKNG